LKDFENFIESSNSSLNDMKKWIGTDEPTETQISKRVQMRLIELRDNVIGKLEKSGVFLENPLPSDSAPLAKGSVINKNILNDLSKLTVSVTDGLLGIGVKNNVFEAMSKTRADILEKIASSENTGVEHSN